MNDGPSRRLGRDARRIHRVRRHLGAVRPAPGLPLTEGSGCERLTVGIGHNDVGAGLDAGVPDDDLPCAHEPAYPVSETSLNRQSPLKSTSFWIDKLGSTSVTVTVFESDAVAVEPSLSVTVTSAVLVQLPTAVLPTA